MIFVTGGAGFIGSNFIANWFDNHDEAVVSYDALTYAGSTLSLEAFTGRQDFEFVRGDINDRKLLCSLFEKHKPRAILNFAAESHVDRSIDAPAVFLNTNVMGTFNLLEATRTYLAGCSASAAEEFRFLHVSTDEVYGSLDTDDLPFHEDTPYAPNSAYSASKAASDHLVRAWHHTYDVPVLTTNCSNNYGPYQYPEKLIPVIINNAIHDQALPVYGDGLNVRDWLYVTDHCNAIRIVLQNGTIGETYNIGGNCEIPNLTLVKTLCAELDRKKPRSDGLPYSEQIKFVTDRPGHDRRYAIDSSKISTELGWQPSETFASGLEKTVNWYLDNPQWIEAISADMQNSVVKENA